jgi:pilus assembly protein CpaD
LGLLALCITPLLGGCNSVDRTVTSSVPMEDYRLRHPIVLAENTTKLDIFPARGPGLDRRSADLVRQFGTTYRHFGHGHILVLLPQGGAGMANRGMVDSITRILTASGGAPVQVSTYPVGDPQLASPIRLTFLRLEAKVPHPCGDWPSDLASGSTLDGWENKPYWNFGCANQSALAAQIADPRDLIGPRAEDQPDTVIRTRAIVDIRAGKDPGVTWNTKNTSISSVGAQ